MKLTFSIQYHTTWGQNLYVCGNIAELGNWEVPKGIPMQLRQNGRWELNVDISDIPSTLEYKYFLKHEQDEDVQWEFGENRKLSIEDVQLSVIDFRDAWREWEGHGRTWFSDAFTKVLMYPDICNGAKEPIKPIANTIHRFQVYAPRVGREYVVCLIGDGDDLGNWDESKAIVMEGGEYPLWTVDIKLNAHTNDALAYKYGIYDQKKKKIVSWESGENQWISPASNARQKRLLVKTDNLFRYEHLWRGTGVALPVFSLRTQNSWGVGEFLDLKLLVDWAAETSQKLVQILPINDTIATHTWVDSYPYAAISVFALHPIYLNPSQVALQYKLKLSDRFEKNRIALNELIQIDYEAVLKLKSESFKWLYDQVKSIWLADKNYLEFFEENKSWLIPYAAFSYFRDRYGTPDFRKWEKFKEYDQEKIYAFCAPTQPHYDDIAIHYFIQYHLHLQLSEASNYAQAKGIVFKGDIPIGIYRHSVDAWVAPELYNMESQAGAPPDDFAVNGQNWGFPTYNWERMAQNGYQWWRERLTKMATYFHAYRIDHILGFFRIWEIPYDSVQGLLGQFNPALPIYLEELDARGIWFDYDRLCKPYIRQHFLHEYFGDLTESVKQLFLHEYHPGHFELKRGFQTQRQINEYLNARDDMEGEIKETIRNGLFSLINEVIFLETPVSDGQAFSPRISMHGCRSYQELDGDMKHKLNELYNDYFFHRQEDFWKHQALTKLPPITQATRMLVCGEDLGMVPACVPSVMDELGILSLRIQRMPHKGEFGVPSQALYMSVLSPSSHDMSTLRGWWEEDRDRSQRFFNHMLGYEGGAPYFLEPWVAQTIIRQHLDSPAMWAIFPLQDLMAMDDKIRWENTQEERINIPAIAQHYWRYRMHIGLEELLKADRFNELIRDLIRESGRDTLY